MKFSRLLIYLLSIALLVSCATSKSFYKKGSKLEEAGLVEEAANMYYVALQKNRNNVDAKIGMKGAGQVVLNSMLNEFVQKKSFGDKKEAITAWEEAMKLKAKVANVGVQLDVPSMYQKDYDLVKSDYVAEIYEEGLELMDQGEFNEAEKRFIEIKRLDPSFEDAHELADVAYVEPIYINAVQAYENEQFRKAYNQFSKVISRKTDYKEANILRQSALDNGLFTMALLPFDNGTRVSGLEVKMSAYTLEALTGANDPFLKIVDRDNIELILEEQKLGLSGIMDEETAVSVGQIIGAQAIISGAILSYGESIGRPQRYNRVGYEQYQVKRINEETGKVYYQTKYRQKNYDEFVGQNLVTVSFQYKVVSLKTGEILKSRIIEREVKDEIHYASYEGDIRNLYPAGNNGANTSRSAKTQLVSLFSARRDLKSVDQLSNDAFQDLGNEMKSDIEQLMKELVP